MDPRPADLISRSDTVRVQPESHAFATRFRRSIEYGAMAPPATEEYHGRRTMYKKKTL